MQLNVGTWNDTIQPVKVNLETLLSSRALITANSGGGKSYCLRGIIEALAGHVQQILIDTDGEFASLREKFDFVICAPKGGDAVAHPKTAALLCRRLMETKVSAVLDISELQARERHTFVRVFLETLMGLGKDLWSPMVLHLDEAHIYCPEKGQGESEASEAVIDLACRGRKRGFCLIAATQRLSKLRKDAAAELLNRLIGRTGLDLDVKRAAFELGMSPTSAQALLPHLAPGKFFAYGPAIASVMRGMTAATVKTSHPKPGVARVKDLPKPTPAVKAVLPQLADLQKESEEEARTLQDLRTELSKKNQELRTLTRDLDQARVAPAPKADPEVLRTLKAQVSVLLAANKRLLKLAGEGHKWMARLAGDAQTYAEEVAKSAERYRGHMDPQLAQGASVGALVDGVTLATTPNPVEPKARPRLIPPLFEIARVKAEGELFEYDPGAGDPNFKPSEPQRRILDALAWLEHKNIQMAPRAMLSAVAQYRGGAFHNNISSLKKVGAIAYVDSNVVLTTMGRSHAQSPLNDGRNLAEHWLEFVSVPQRKILLCLMDAERPMSRDEVSERIDYRGGAFHNNVSALSTLGAIYYPSKGMMALTKNVIP